MTATLAIDRRSEQPQSRSGHTHNPNMDPETITNCLPKSNPPLSPHHNHNRKHNHKHNINPSTVTSNEDDPLAHPEAIEVVQQSDTPFNEQDEDESSNNDISTWSYAPIRNLMGAFDDMSDMNEEQVLLCSDDHIKSRTRSSPNGIDQYESPNNHKNKNQSHGNPSRKSNTPFPTTIKLDMPHFKLHEGLRLTLSQPVLDRCSFYSVIYGVNKEVNDMASHDQNCHVEEQKDEGSALVLAVNGPIKRNPPKDSPKVELAVIDEEKFLLAAIASRTEEEIPIRDCPQSFAEAIGESDALTVSEESCLSGHSENPLAVVSASRTQLWKPSRSWWEAKSGKNPWIEPTLHNKRWRFLWPLIHYHKFLAKCIKKLKRNKVDVKTSLSPVSAFLREEVCAVSDHLACVSKFDSEDWMNALPYFDGWISTSDEDEQIVRDLVKMLPMRKLDETKEYVESPRYRALIDASFDKAMANNREQMAAGDEYQYSDQGSEKRMSAAPSGLRKANANAAKGNNRPPRPGSRNGGARPARGASKRNGRPHRQNHHGYQPVMNQTMMQNHMMNMSMHSMYSYDPYIQANQSAHYMPPHPENEYYYAQSNPNWVPMAHGPDYEINNFSYLDQSMVSTDMQYYPHNNENPDAQGNWSGVPPSEISNSVCGEEMSQCSEQASQVGGPEGVSLSFIGTKINANMENCKTPSKDRSAGMHAGAPPSPYWGHLNMATLAMSGLASPGARHPPSPQHFVYDHNDNAHANGQMYNNGQLKPPLINSYNPAYQGVPGMVPPSPATQFMMSSSHANRHNQGYFGQDNPHVQNKYTSPVKHSGQPYSADGKSSEPSDESSSATTEASSTDDVANSAINGANEPEEIPSSE